MKEGTTVADPTRTVKYLAFENAAGKYMEYGATTLNWWRLPQNGTQLSMPLTSLPDWLMSWVCPQTPQRMSRGKTGGGIDTTQDGGTVSVTIQDGTTSVTRAVSVTQNANQSFILCKDLETAINTDFAGDGYSVAVTAADGAFSLTLDQAGAKTVTLAGSIVEDAFASPLQLALMVKEMHSTPWMML